ncbi:pyruvate kinase [Candidatus Parcubacteria bacterium A4]|nr:MAG: pyruvate kinase [Candidatus Parcubacteria bacterium A4]
MDGVHSRSLSLTRMKKTKIIATIGPASESHKNIAALMKAGTNIFRFNMKHSTVEWHNERIKRVQKISDSLKNPVGIMIDLQGPEIRILTKNKGEISFKKNEWIIFGKSFSSPKINMVIPNCGILKMLKKNDLFSIDNGFFEFEVVKKEKEAIIARALGEGLIKNRKGVNFPGKKIELPSLIKDDLKKLDMAARTKIDFIALSFSRTKENIELLRNEMKKRKITAQIVAKIENKEALDNIEELIEAADATMIARGDLGVEIPIEQIAYWQKLIISKCREKRKPVIVATQMLMSMINNPSPSRAEATDVANAVFDGTDAVMLSEETAIGKYPVKTVETMSRILNFNEKKCPSLKLPLKPNSFVDLISEAGMEILENHKDFNITKALVFTSTGYSARALSCLRPNIPIITITNNKKTADFSALLYGVTSFFVKFPTGDFRSPLPILNELKKQGLIKINENVLIIYGGNWKKIEINNSLSIAKVN